MVIMRRRHRQSVLQLRQTWGILEPCPRLLRRGPYEIQCRQQNILSFCVWRSSTTHAAQSACHRSNPVRPETCCEGVRDSRTSAFTTGPPALEERETCKKCSSHQSSSWTRESSVFSVLERYATSFSLTNMWAEDDGLARRPRRRVGISVLVKASDYSGGR